MNKSIPPPAHSGLSLGLGLIAMLAGFIIALGVLAGDAQGRVNLLYLLLLFAFLPVLGLFLSLLFLLRGQARGLAGWLLELPWWPRHWYSSLLHLHEKKLRKFFLFYQTQVIALGFGIGGLLAFMLLLLGTDVSFVWRSTLLQAPDLYPVLRTLAWPWQFWQQAQPTLELLQQSQDFRLAQQSNTALELGRWWTYALAAQCTYNLFPRAILLLIARSVYRAQSQAAATSAIVITQASSTSNSIPAQGQLAPLISALATPYVLIDWAGLPGQLGNEITRLLGKPQQLLSADPVANFTGPDRLEFDASANLVVTVKAWEAPLGELRDVLEGLPRVPGSTRAIMPLDWEGEELRPLSEVHLHEWRRFAALLPDWQVLLSSAESEVSL